MQLKPGQLPQHLKKQGLAPVYCLSGDEPLQMLETADLIRATTREHGFEERNVLVVEKEFEWSRLQQATANLSLFSSRRLIELRLGSQKPGREGGTALVEFTRTLDTDTVLLITAARLDKQAQQSAWFKALDAVGVSIQIWPVEATALPGWVISRGRQYGMTISQEAAEFIAQRAEGNLLAARQELEKLHLLLDKAEIGIGDILNSVTDSSRYDVFAMLEAAMTGQAERCLRMLRGLRQEGTEPLGIHAALLWQMRLLIQVAAEQEGGMSRSQAFIKYRIWQQRQQAVTAVLDRLGAGRLIRLLAEAHQMERVMKGAIRDDPWNLLENFMLRIAGLRLKSLLRAL